MRVINLHVYDAILGYDWLKPRSPMDCHWANKTIAFEENGTKIKIQGILTQKDMGVQEMSAEQIVKWAKGNDIWAYAVVQEVNPEDKLPVPQPITNLLKEFKDVFSTPHKLPPPRAYDHAISLLPNSIPVNSKPY
jgi:hypothetical protein